MVIASRMLIGGLIPSFGVNSYDSGGDGGGRHKYNLMCGYKEKKSLRNVNSLSEIIKEVTQKETSSNVNSGLVANI